MLTFTIITTFLTNSQRISTKGHTAPTIVTPAVGESQSEAALCHDVLSPMDKSAAPYCCSICCLHSLMHFDGGTTPKSAPCHRGTWPPPNTWFLRPTQVHNQNGISTGSATFVGFTVDKHTHTHTQTTSLH